MPVLDIPILIPLDPLYHHMPSLHVHWPLSSTRLYLLLGKRSSYSYYPEQCLACSRHLGNASMSDYWVGQKVCLTFSVSSTTVKVLLKYSIHHEYVLFIAAFYALTVNEKF